MFTGDFLLGTFDMYHKGLTLSILLLINCLLITNSYADNKNATRKADKLLASNQYPKAYKEYLRLAEEQQNPSALYTLALFHELGWGRKIDKKQACSWYEQAAVYNVPAALDSLGHCYEKGIHKKLDNIRAAELYQKAADFGHHYSLCKLAKLYVKGLGVVKDIQKGIGLCQKSAEQGSIPAMLQLGDIYLEINTTESLKAALAWYSNAASYRAPQAEYKLGEMLLEGKGLKQDPIEAREWFEKAASKGYHPAYFRTAALYFDAPKHPDTGLWTENDLAKTYLWLSVAIERGSNTSQLESLNNMLIEVKKVMPPTWVESLSAKVQVHLEKYPVTELIE